MSFDNSFNILIVDDREENLLTLEAVLEELDVELIKATSGNEALRALLVHDIALVLLDVQMPVMDGFETAELMRGSVRTRHIPIIFVTAISKEKKHIFRGYDSGAVDYLFKPIEPEILKSKVSVFIDLHKQKVALEQLTHKLEHTISDLINSQSELRKTMDLAEIANKTKSEFLANMSHEIRTPLNGIIGMSELVLLGKLNSDQREKVEIIKQSGESLLEILNEILDISKIEADKMQLESIDFNLLEVFENAITMISVKAYERKIELLLSVSEEIQRNFIGDPVRIRQILLNLIGNAIKFTKQGEVGIYAEYDRCEDDFCIIKVSIIDTGIGIPKDKISALFDTFTQADSSTTRKFGGTGLGLSISKNLVEMMGGEIIIESEFGKGSKFSFTIKLMKGKTTPTKEDLKIDISDENFKALIIDDNLSGRKILSSYLDTWKIANDGVSSGQEAIDIIVNKKKQYNIIFVDYLMPEMNGVDFVTKLLELINKKEKPYIVLLSMSQTFINKEELLKIGIDNFITKPVFIKEICDVFNKLTGKEIVELHEDSDIEESKEKVIQNKSINVLLAEDNLINQRLAVGFMKLNGWKVTVANDGLEAKEYALVNRYDIIFMDVQMPNMDGFEATQEIRKFERTIDVYTPIVAMTAHAMVGYKQKCLDQGMDDYITKPFNSSELVRIVKELT